MSEPTNELKQFSALVGKVISVPKTEILRREAEYRKRVDANLNRRGPKKKITSASPVPDASSLA